MRQFRVQVSVFQRIKKDVFLLGFDCPYLVKEALPGQFIHIKVRSPELLLRRPFSIHKIDKKTVYLLFRIKGKGTLELSRHKIRQTLDIIGPLGRGFTYKGTLHSSSGMAFLLAGGMGVAPLLFLAQKLNKLQSSNYKLQRLVLLGAKTRNELLCQKEFRNLGFKALIATEDGSKGFKGTATDFLKHILSIQYPVHGTTIYACGPEGMFKELSIMIRRYPQINCQVSFEQFMGCGIGVCRACVIKTKLGYKRVCKDGPVFNIKDVF